MGFFDNLRKNNFFDDETPLGEPQRFRERTAAQQKKLSPGIQKKLLEESSAANPEAPNRGVLYAVGLVLALVIIGGNGIFYNLTPGETFSPIGADQMREAAEVPSPRPDAQRTVPPDFGSSSGTQK